MSLNGIIIHQVVALFVILQLLPLLHLFPGAAKSQIKSNTVNSNDSKKNRSFYALQCVSMAFEMKTIFKHKQYISCKLFGRNIYSHIKDQEIMTIK